jgi:hypothetical protein
LFAAALTPALLQTDTCMVPDGAMLAVLELRVGSAEGEDTIDGFDPEVLLYLVQFPASEETAILRVEAQDPTATIEIRHDRQPVPFASPPYAELDVPVGESVLRVRVSVDTDGRPHFWTYLVRIERSGAGTLSVGIEVQEEGAAGGMSGADP